MFRKFNFFLFILLFSCIFGLTHTFADENGEPDEIFKFPVSEGPTDISVLPETQIVPEGIIGGPDFEKMRDLPKNSQDYQLGRKVGHFRIPTRNEPGLFWVCTGFLVGPDLFMTNLHCFHDNGGQLPITGARIFMDYYEEKAVDSTYGGVTARVSAIVHANAEKDYALLRLDKPIGNTYGWLKLDTTLNPDDRSQRVKLISHPLGRSKEIVRRNSPILALTPVSRARYPHLLAYLADSVGGSSGSPVFLRDGTGVVAIHHSGLFNRNTGAAVANLGSLMSHIVPEIQQYLPGAPAIRPSTTAVPQYPDLVVETPRLINNSNLFPGASFTLSATVRNRGTAAATATTLRFYQSTDTTITTFDTQIGTAGVAALNPGGTTEINISLNAPITLGTHHYGACVDAVNNENASDNNCSPSVTLTVAEPAYPDLVVETSLIINDSLIPGASFRLSATVKNRGAADATATTLRFYRSTDTTITASDTQIGTADVAALNHNGTTEISITLKAPTTLGTHHYGACVDSVDNENDSDNNCSPSVTLTVAEPETPDLVVETPLVSSDSLIPGASFTLSATVKNRGTAAATATTLRFYQSTDTTITTSDTQIGTADVAALNSGGTAEISITLNAPTTLGTHHYGACVDAVDNENNSDNNCSPSVTITVAEPEYPDLVVETPLVSSDSLIPGASFTLSATVRNRGAADATATTLRFYQSTDTTLTPSDTQIRTADVAALNSGGTAEIGITLKAPTTLGTHYYGACVDSVDNENASDNNCSPSVTITVAEPAYPDLVVETPRLINNYLLPGDSFTLSATVRNRGDAAATVTTLRFYQSTDATLTPSDTQIGTADVAALNSGGTAEISITLNAPITLGTHYYGACVDAVDNENDSDNNCSPSVTLTVSDTPPVYMYWTDTGTDKVQRAHLDGSNIKDIITTGFRTPTNIKVDTDWGYLYWTDSGTDKIQRANLDGSNIEDIVTTGLKTPTSIAVDAYTPNLGKIYWTDSGTDKVQRANLDGSNIEDIVTTGLGTPTGIAVDLVNSKMYWTDISTDKVQRANLDGSNIEDIITTGLRTPTSIEIDPEAGKIYWTDSGTNKVQRANLDGSNMEDIITTGLRIPTSIAIDPEAGKIYWTDSGTGKIQRANLDGSNIEDIVTTGLRIPTSIALGIPQVVSPSLSGPAPGPLDVNDDGQVTAMDLVVVALLYGTRVPVGVSLPADVNADGVVNILDLNGYRPRD